VVRRSFPNLCAKFTSMLDRAGWWGACGLNDLGLMPRCGTGSLFCSQPLPEQHDLGCFSFLRLPRLCAGWQLIEIGRWIELGVFATTASGTVRYAEIAPSFGCAASADPWCCERAVRRCRFSSIWHGRTIFQDRSWRQPAHSALKTRDDAHIYRSDVDFPLGLWGHFYGLATRVPAAGLED